MSTAALGGEGSERTQPAAPPVLPLVWRLAGLLAEESVAYCHWKSNAAIDRSASGENDLDLLVDRGDLDRFVEVVSRLGFKRVQRSGSAVPGIESFYGFDAEADRLVHLHAHYQLVLGDDRTKNYRLPIEEAYIRSATPGDVFPLPAPELELVVLVIRLTLKYCTWDEIAWRALRRRRAGPKPSEWHEFEYLRSRADESSIASILSEHLPYVEEDVFAECVAALDEDAALLRRTRAGRRLEIALQPHARRSRGADRRSRIWGRVALGARRRRRARGGRLVGGGAMVGLIGGDGSGKTTALATLGDWLGPVLDVRVVHLGKPRWSVTTYAARGSLKAAVLVANGLQRWVRVAPVRRLASVLSTYRPHVWLLCTARDRQRAYRKARRFANNGGLVLCDRYPHPHLSSMEVPLIARRAAALRRGRLLGAMIRLEEHYHRPIAPPELLVVLRVDPEVAVVRKSDERPESVRARGAEFWSIDWSGSGAHVVDAGQSPEAVARELKELVWASVA